MHTDYQALVRDDRVHGSLYVEPGVFRDEMTRIFHRGWSFIAHASEVPEPGCWITRRIGLEPYILTRDMDGRLHALANRCSHRGTALCWEERGRSKHFQCTYHGWSFALDGRLTGVAYRGGLNKDMGELGLDRAGQVEAYRGFIFVNPSGTAGPLAAHLGTGGQALIDRLCDLSPQGSIRVPPTWIGHRIASNWKMWPESDNDGYHFQFVHSSTVKAAPDTYYQETVLGGESGNISHAVDHGQGHFELDLRPSYKAPLAWLGTTQEKTPEYCTAMESAYGAERAGQLMMDGPPHAMIFPNLFLGELNLAIVEPVAPNITVHHHTAVQLEGVDARINRRILRQSEAALGPASFIVPDDAVTAEKMQSGFGGASPENHAAQGKAWIDLSRGMARETMDGPRRVGQVSDETTNRAFWRHYRDVMGATS
jgi:phenylpropionate dioxygenase-like ring-hydroxylating dioxygenase large terminal subunit